MRGQDWDRMRPDGAGRLHSVFPGTMPTTASTVRPACGRPQSSSRPLSSVVAETGWLLPARRRDCRRPSAVLHRDAR